MSSSESSGSKKKVLILYTGGTIGCKRSDPDNPESPLDVARWEEFQTNCPAISEERQHYEIDHYEFVPPIDSTNMQPQKWREIVEKLEDNYDSYDGFVILHGTDTMVYTASALSFMIDNLAKPIVITGSQLPIINHMRSDGEQNLITALRIAAQFDGVPLVPEVTIFFRDKLLRGNRSRKINATGYQGFDSPNYPVLGEAGESIRVNEKFVKEKPSDNSRPVFLKSLDTNIIPLPLFPGIQDGPLLKRVVDLDASAIVIQAYGTGNAPTNGSFIEALDASNREEHRTHLLAVTQCLIGKAMLGNYETSAHLLELGVLSGADITPEAALCKLMVLLGDEDRSFEDIQMDVQRDLRGEQSESTYVANLADSGGELRSERHSSKPNVRIPAKTPAPAGWEPGRVVGAYLRLRGVEMSSSRDSDKSYNIRLQLYHDVSGEELEKLPERKMVGSEVVKNSDYFSPIMIFDVTELIDKSQLEPAGRRTSFTLSLKDAHTGFVMKWEQAELMIVEQSLNA